jgi:hypothetical protein
VSGITPSVLGVRRVKDRNGRFLKIIGGQDRAGQWSCTVAGIVPHTEYKFTVDIVRFQAVNGMYPRIRLFDREYLLDAVWFSKYEHHVVLTANSGTCSGTTEITLINDNPTPMYFKNPGLVRIAQGTGYGVLGNPPSRVFEHSGILEFWNSGIRKPRNQIIPGSQNSLMPSPSACLSQRLCGSRPVFGPGVQNNSPEYSTSRNSRIPESRNQKKFPLGLYGTKPADLQTIDHSPFNIVRLPATPEAVAAAHARGLNVFCSMPSDPGKAAALAETFARAGVSFSPHDLFYIDDEPELRSIDPKHLRDKRETLAEIWPHVRGLMANVRPWAVARYMDTADIFAMDQYPVPSQPMTWLSDSMDQAGTLVRGTNREVWSIIQAFGGKSAAIHGWPAFPSYEEMRNLTFLSLLHGARGVFYYTYSHGKKDPARWQDLKAIGNQVRDIEEWLTSPGAFTPLAVHVDSRFTVDAAGNPAVHVGTKTVNGKTLVLAVNVIDRPVDVVVRTGGRETGDGRREAGDRGRKTEILTAPFADTPAVVRDGTIRLHLEPHEVRVLIDGADTGKTWKGRRIGVNGEQRKRQLVAMAPLREWGPSW